MRWSSGTLPTDRRFTGQREETGLGLYDYAARRYDPLLGRFIQADTIVPSPQSPQSLNRYAYVLNSPLGLYDPDGHFPLAIALILLAAGGGFIGDWSLQVARNVNLGMGFWDATSQQHVDLGQSVRTAAAVGGVTAAAVTAAPVVAATAGQTLMGVGIATSSTALWTAGTSTVAAGTGLYDALWGPSLPTLTARDGGTYAHGRLEQEYLRQVPADQRPYVDLDRRFTNPAAGRVFRPDVVNHWTGEVVEYKPASWNDNGYLHRQATNQVQGYVNTLNSVYGDWRTCEGLSPYRGRVEHYDPSKYFRPE